MTAAHDEEGPPRGLARADAAGLLAGLAGLTLWVSLTDSLYRFVRPSMRPWLILSGLFVAALAVAVAITSWRDGRRHRHPSGRRLSVVGWVLLLPVIIAVSTDPGALGSFAVRQRGGSPVAAPSEFDLEAYLGSHSTAGQDPSLRLGQFLSAATDPEDRALLARTDVRVTGFVVGDAGDGEPKPDTFSIARLMVGCCAGDAVPLLVEVYGLDGDRPPDDTWVEVSGRFDPSLTDRTERSDQAGTPMLRATSLRRVSEPREPYEYP